MSSMSDQQPLMTGGGGLRSLISRHPDGGGPKTCDPPSLKENDQTPSPREGGGLETRDQPSRLISGRASKPDQLPSPNDGAVLNYVFNHHLLMRGPG